MGVDHAKGGGLRAQMQQNAHQHGVLEDIGEIAGMKGVAVVHADGVTCAGLSGAKASRSIGPIGKLLPDTFSVKVISRQLSYKYVAKFICSLAGLCERASEPGRLSSDIARPSAAGLLPGCELRPRATASSVLATLDDARCMRYLKGYIDRMDAQLRSAD